MSKSVEAFKKLMESDRGEASQYELATPDDQVRTPITRSGFEAMVLAACKLVDLEVTGPNRNIAVAFLHSLGRGTAKTTIRALSDNIWSSLSNHTTFSIDQEIKKEANEELREEHAKMAEAQKQIHQANKSQRKALRQELRKGSKTAVKLPSGSPDEKSN